MSWFLIPYFAHLSGAFSFRATILPYREFAFCPIWVTSISPLTRGEFTPRGGLTASAFAPLARNRSPRQERRERPQIRVPSLAAPRGKRPRADFGHATSHCISDAFIPT
jgi:hypothetical protein